MFKVYAINNKTKMIEEYWLPDLHDIEGDLAELDASGPHRIDGPAVLNTTRISVDEPLSTDKHRDINLAHFYLGGIRYYALYALNEEIRRVRAMPPEIRLTDPRQWVRDFK